MDGNQTLNRYVYMSILFSVTPHQSGKKAILEALTNHTEQTGSSKQWQRVLELVILENLFP